MGIGLIGAMAHNLTQLSLAYLLFIRRMEAILFVAPLILFLGIITGLFNGMASSLLLKKLGEKTNITQLNPKTKKEEKI
ncbi:heptaprenyl diphosphate synthase component I [bacterium BMS3Bbin07]|nr:heptaprenyl diphosphate synthase component I [bacterium BMS3Bbin07]